MEGSAAEVDRTVDPSAADVDDAIENDVGSDNRARKYAIGTADDSADSLDSIEMKVAYDRGAFELDRLTGGDPGDEFCSCHCLRGWLGVGQSGGRLVEANKSSTKKHDG